MRLVRIYSNQPEDFHPIEFREGFSVVLGEIRVPENRDLDVHNLGKSTLALLIDFCLLRGKNPKFFLYREGERFAGHKFFLEVQLPDGTFLTIARAVLSGTTIDFKRSPASIVDANDLAPADWDHRGVTFDRAKSLLDGMLGIEALKPWPFRKLVGYLVRGQWDYKDVFQLDKFSGKDSTWKPFVAHILGMDAELARDLYAKRDERDEVDEQLKALMFDWGEGEGDPAVISALIAVKERQIRDIEADLDALNFRDQDAKVTDEVVEETEAQIAGLNEERYELTNLVRRLESSLEKEKVIFDPGKAKELFDEAGVLLPDELRKDYEQLISFNSSVTEERREALGAQLASSRERIDQITAELKVLNEKRAQSLAFLRESDSVAKFRELSGELGVLRGELGTLESKRTAAARLTEMRRLYRTLVEEFNVLQTAAEEEAERMNSDKDGFFATLRGYFDEIVHNVLGQSAILAISVNRKGGLEFTAEFVNEAGVATAGDQGTTYRKLLCIAFDLALLRAYGDVDFPRFVYHDGALESLETRKKENLLAVFRDYAGYGIQPIITVLDSDLPPVSGDGPPAVSSSEVIVTLHDEGEDGRLFKLEQW